MFKKTLACVITSTLSLSLHTTNVHYASCLHRLPRDIVVKKDYCRRGGRHTRILTGLSGFYSPPYVHTYLHLRLPNIMKHERSWRIPTLHRWNVTWSAALLDIAKRIFLVWRIINFRIFHAFDLRVLRCYNIDVITSSGRYNRILALIKYSVIANIIFFSTECLNILYLYVTYITNVYVKCNTMEV